MATGGVTVGRTFFLRRYGGYIDGPFPVIHCKVVEIANFVMGTAPSKGPKAFEGVDFEGSLGGLLESHAGLEEPAA